MKSFLKLFLFGLAGGLIGSYIFVTISGRTSGEISRPIIPTPLETLTPEPESWAGIVSESSLKIVAIQVLKDNRLVRQGSGLIISSDGLIVTSADLGTASAIYQIFYDDRITKAKSVKVDYNLNLLLLKTDDSYSNIAELNEGQYYSGTDIILVGKLVNFAKPVTFSQNGIISYITENNVVVNTNFNNSLTGAGVLSNDGNFIGLGFLRSGGVNLVKGSVIENFFQDYITEENKRN